MTESRTAKQKFLAFLESPYLVYPSLLIFSIILVARDGVTLDLTKDNTNNEEKRTSARGLSGFTMFFSFWMFVYAAYKTICLIPIINMSPGCTLPARFYTFLSAPKPAA